MQKVYLEDLKDLLLVLIFQTSGKWNWYQIERHLGGKLIGGGMNFVTLINEFIKDGYVIQHIPKEKSYPVYLITENGAKKVNTLIEENGVEYYTTDFERFKR